MKIVNSSTVKNIVEKVGDKQIKVSRVDNEKQTKMYHGTVNSNIANAIRADSSF